MKKTVTINISGIIFHIDEDAFEMLSHYLNRVKSHFANSEGRDEIVGDIEGRIAEILQEKLTQGKQVVSIEEINEVIGLMGEPAEFDETTAEATVSRSDNRPKRLYRDPDNKMVAGVSSGLAWYFNIDPAWIRGLFIVTLFISGAGAIAYLIMWLVVPEARTTAEKLEMKGEPVNLSNIEASISQEFDGIKEKFNDLAEEAKQSFKKKDKPTLVEDILRLTGSVLGITFRIIRIIVGVFLTLFSFVAVLSLLAGISGLSSFSFFDHGELMGFSLPLFLQMVFSNPLMEVLAIISVGLIVFVPLLMLFYFGLRLLIGKRVKINYIGRTATGLWLAGLVIGAVVALNVSFDFRHVATHAKSEIRIPMTPTDTLFLDAVENDESKLHLYFEAFGKNVQIDGDNYHLYARPDIDFEINRGYFVRVTANAYAKGRTAEAAYNRAGSIDYPLSNVNSVFLFPDYFFLPPNSLIRDQQLRVRVEIPEGQLVHLSGNMRKLLNSDWWFYRKHRGYIGDYWVMTEDGLTPFREEVSGEAAE